MTRGKVPATLIAIKSRVTTGVGGALRVDVGVASSVEVLQEAVRERLGGVSVQVVASWTPSEGEDAAALMRLLRRYPASAEVLSSMAMAFMDTNDGTYR